MIHPTALVNPAAKIGSGVSIGPFSIIHGNVEIADGTNIGSHCEIGFPTPLAEGRKLVIGKNSLIRSHSVFYEGSTIGDGLTTGHRVTVRELTVAGPGFQIGTLGDIQGSCNIGNYVRFHSNVHIGRGSKIGDFAWIFPYVVLTNDPHPPSDLCIGVEIGECAAIATMSVILPGVKVGKHSLVAAPSMVRRDVEPMTVVGGNPAKFLCNTREIKMKDGTGRSAYPWTDYVRRRYPAEVIDRWQLEMLDRMEAGQP